MIPQTLSIPARLCEDGCRPSVNWAGGAFPPAPPVPLLILDHVMNNLSFFTGLAVALALIITAGVLLARHRWKSATVVSLSAMAVTLVMTVA
jgi:hypothetical protein